VAYAKIKAVYPKMTKEMIAKATPEELVRQPAVRQVLGTVRKLRATTAASLYRQLQEYVDSKEKNTEKRMEFWPLIKVVRIYTKASALATGACLVDLPGVQDSNAARAAVAANYMKACTGLWIVAPITRAVDDKTAKSLLGDSFRYVLFSSTSTSSAISSFSSSSFLLFLVHSTVITIDSRADGVQTPAQVRRHILCCDIHLLQDGRHLRHRGGRESGHRARDFRVLVQDPRALGQDQESQIRHGRS
jgi:hypothetical protein